ncbi:MAG: hypothetical protein JSR76_05305 [Verrucomicrobia bacterium]|jgi:hypothetical protein|nr:hypothetical protein [Verrucomicrobiota bacterium]
MEKQDYEKQCAIAAMRWYGWGSPIGLSIFFAGIALCVLIIRKAFCG